MLFRQLFDTESSTFTYLLADEETREAVLIDPVLEQVDRDLALVRELDLRLVYVLDTHVHADHVTGAGLLRERTGAKTGVAEVAEVACKDVGLGDGDRLSFGRHTLEVIATPGHTSGCLTYRVEDKVFTGDALLIRGSGRTDFQQGSPEALYRSVTERLFTLPDSTAVYPGHDYKGRTVSSIGEEKRHNPRFANKSLPEFRQIMAELKLAMPKKLAVAVPANQRCGRADVAAPSAMEFLAKSGAERVPGGGLEVPVAFVADPIKTAGVRIVDVREPHELVRPLEPIDGAENVPLGLLEGVAKGWPRKAPLIVVCRSGARSLTAARLLEGLGFAAPVSMRGGMLAFRGAFPEKAAPATCSA